MSGDIKDETTSEAFDTASLIASFHGNASGPLASIDLALGSSADHGRLMMQMISVMQHFVRERCDNEKLDARKLEQDWDNLVALFRAHMKAISEEARRQREAVGKTNGG